MKGGNVARAGAAKKSGDDKKVRSLRKAASRREPEPEPEYDDEAEEECVFEHAYAYNVCKRAVFGRRADDRIDSVLFFRGLTPALISIYLLVNAVVLSVTDCISHA